MKFPTLPNNKADIGRHWRTKIKICICKHSKADHYMIRKKPAEWCTVPDCPCEIYVSSALV